MQNVFMSIFFGGGLGTFPLMVLACIDGLSEQGLRFRVRELGPRMTADGSGFKV